MIRTTPNKQHTMDPFQQLTHAQFQSRVLEEWNLNVPMVTRAHCAQSAVKVTIDLFQRVESAPPFPGWLVECSL